MSVFFFASITPIGAEPLRVIPSLALSERVDDNIFRAREDRTTDTVTLLSPGLRISPNEKRGSSAFEYRAQIERYAEHRELDTVKHFADLEWTASFSENRSIQIENRFSYSPDSTELSTQGVVVPRGDAYANHAFLGLNLSFFDFSYRNTLEEFVRPEFRDSLSHDFEERAIVPMTFHYHLTQSYRMRYFTRDGIEALRTHSVGGGLRYQFSTHFWIGAEGGVTYWRTTDDDTFQSAPMVRVELERAFKHLKLGGSYFKDFETEWNVHGTYETKKGEVRLAYTKELIARGGLLGGAVDSRTVSIRLRQEVGRKETLTLSGHYGIQKELENGGERVDIYRGEAGYSYRIRPWLVAGLDYQFFKQDSKSLSQSEFTRNRGTLSLTAVLP